jgi:hypothetical protein
VSDTDRLAALLKSAGIAEWDCEHIAARLIAAGVHCGDGIGICALPCGHPGVHDTAAPAPPDASDAALTLAARAMVTHLYQTHSCEHDFEGHDLMGIERYLVRRWTRYAEEDK